MMIKRASKREPLPEGIVVNCYRPHLLGNPFPVKRYGREGAIERYHQWLREQYRSNLEIRLELEYLARTEQKHTVVLVCYCKTSQACHCDVITAAIRGVGQALRKKENADE